MLPLIRPLTSCTQSLMETTLSHLRIGTFRFNLGESTLLVAAKVRSYLDTDSLLPPRKTLSHADPTLFQRLDHTLLESNGCILSGV